MKKDVSTLKVSLVLIYRAVLGGNFDESRLQAICLLVQINDWSLRCLGLREMATGFGFITAKPFIKVFAPVAVTPDEMGDLLGKMDALTCILNITWNGERFWWTSLVVKWIFLSLSWLLIGTNSQIKCRLCHRIGTVSINLEMQDQRVSLERRVIEENRSCEIKNFSICVFGDKCPYAAKLIMSRWPIWGRDRAKVIAEQINKGLSDACINYGRKWLCWTSTGKNQSVTRLVLRKQVSRLTLLDRQFWWCLLIAHHSIWWWANIAVTCRRSMAWKTHWGVSPWMLFIHLAPVFPVHGGKKLISSVAVVEYFIATMTLLDICKKISKRESIGTQNLYWCFASSIAVFCIMPWFGPTMILRWNLRLSLWRHKNRWEVDDNGTLVAVAGLMVVSLRFCLVYCARPAAETVNCRLF